MTKKRKYHDPMKTVTINVHSGGAVHSVTHKERTSTSMNRILDKMQQQTNIMLQKTSELQSDKDKEKVCKEYSADFAVLHAKMMAAFLVANNIARRGKPLHPDTALAKLSAHQFKDSSRALIIKLDMGKSVVTDWPLNKKSEQNLHYFLYNDFDVTLMDKSVYDCCMKKIEGYEYRHYLSKNEERDLHRYKNFIKKFHKNVINENGR